MWPPYLKCRRKQLLLDSRLIRMSHFQNARLVLLEKRDMDLVQRILQRIFLKDAANWY